MLHHFGEQLVIGKNVIMQKILDKLIKLVTPLLTMVSLLRGGDSQFPQE